MKQRNIQIEAIFYEMLSKLFADIFTSEMLYAVWDVIIYFIISAKNQVFHHMIYKIEPIKKLHHTHNTSRHYR